jgi:diguanylate cyclase (GGDEF)-like protein/PAS domain S-box-containing protein
MFNQLKFRQKVGLSFGVLMALMMANAVVVALEAWFVYQQMGHQEEVATVLAEVGHVRLLASRFVNSHSREGAQQVFQSLVTTRNQLERTAAALNADQRQRMLSLLDDFKLHFQKYVVESDQRAALESRASVLGKQTVQQLHVAQDQVSIRSRADTLAVLNGLESQFMAMQWASGNRLGMDATDMRDVTTGIRQALVTLGHSYSPSNANSRDGLQLFRIERDAQDYLASFERAQHYQRESALTEGTLFKISDDFQLAVQEVERSMTQVMRRHITQAIVLVLSILLVSVASAWALTRTLRRAILQPVQALVGVTQEIAHGNLQARARVDVNDEIGELSRAFNQMAYNLTESRAELLDKQRALQWAQDSLEQRIHERTEQLVSANQALAARELLVTQIMDTAPISVVLVDMGGRITQANSSMVEMFGYPMETLVSMAYAALVDPAELDTRSQIMQALMNGEIPLVDMDGKFRRANGETFWAHLTGKQICGVSGEKLGLVGVIADITAQREHQQQLENIAHFDGLTGLPNRLLLADRLQQALVQCQRKGNLLAVAYLDLDGFKAVNDSLGHEAGDDLLVTLSHRMKECLREGDTLARIGGDEFVAVLVDLHAIDDCQPLLQRLLNAACSQVARETSTGPQDLQVSASIGVTVFPRDPADADGLMRHADQAMYVAKQSGKNAYHLFDPTHDQAIKTQHESQERIRTALLQNELVLYYQPKVNMRTGRVTGAEALIRWAHPQQGLLAPGAFLPAIEDLPVSIEVGEWVLASAMAQMSAWQRMGLSLPVSVNISAYQLQQSRFTTHLAELLASYDDIHPSWVQLEVLETSALEDMGKVGQAMHACHAMGVHFALDDFGTGYSSLTYLKRLPASTLKIDQSFVRDMLEDAGDLAIVHGVVGLARSFSREVIAEGVETRFHGEKLLAIGCELAQGYGIARPMPADQMPQWVESWHLQAQWTA